jgi:hypothetical protein
MRRVVLTAVAVFALGALLAAVLWTNRYQYLSSSGRVVRVHRWSGRAEVLVGSVWRQVRRELPPIGEDPLDSLARTHGLAFPENRR